MARKPLLLLALLALASLAGCAGPAGDTGPATTATGNGSTGPGSGQGAGDGTGAPAGNATFRGLARGDHSAITEEGTSAEVAATLQEWQALWARHNADRTPQPALPVVDFSREFAVGLFLGNRPSGGYAAEVVEARHEAGRHLLGYRATGPGPACPVTGALTQPFHFVAVRRAAGEPMVALEQVAARLHGCNQQAPAPAPRELVDVVSVERGDLSYETADGLALRAFVDEASWKAFWARHKSGMDPRPEAPAIDFSDRFAVVLLLGERSSSGYAVEALNVTREGNAHRVTFATTEPGPSCLTASVMTRPFHVLSIARSGPGTPTVEAERAERRVHAC